VSPTARAKAISRNSLGYSRSAAQSVNVLRKPVSASY
jgi:hypothetical protein